MTITNYQVPKWFMNHKLFKNIKDIKKIPSKRIKLLDKAETNIEKLDLKKLATPSINKFKLYVKRDDQTHQELQLQGNKLRKLEFLFADAIEKKSQHILTAGGLQSNHCRTVASVCRKFSLKPHLFLRSDTNDFLKLNPNGNLLLNFLLDSNVYLIEKRAQYLQSIEFKMNLLKNRIESKLKENCYLIPIGGSNTIGLFGYIEQFNELIRQNVENFITDIIVTTGSGGTMAGIALANYMTGSKFKIHAFAVCDNSQYFYDHLKTQINNLFMDFDLDPKDLINIIECSKGLGYGKSTQEELEFIGKFLIETNILLDPVYTGKTMFTLYNLLNNIKTSSLYVNDELAKNFLKNLNGISLLFIHTGGQLGNFDSSKYNQFLNLNLNKNVFNCFGEKNILFEFD